jgi:hypothetical protein
VLLLRGEVGDEVADEVLLLHGEVEDEVANEVGEAVAGVKSRGRGHAPVGGGGSRSRGSRSRSRPRERRGGDHRWEVASLRGGVAPRGRSREKRDGGSGGIWSGRGKKGKFLSPLTP